MDTTFSEIFHQGDRIFQNRQSWYFDILQITAHTKDRYNKFPTNFKNVTFPYFQNDTAPK